MPGLSPDVRIETRVPEGFPLTFSNYTMVQTIGPEVVVSFFQVIQPIVDTPGDLEKIKSILAHCTARLALNPFAAEALLRGLAEVAGFQVTKV